MSVLNLELLLFWQEEGRHRRGVKHANNMALTAGFLVNASSVRNKTDELQANVRRLHEYMALLSHGPPFGNAEEYKYLDTTFIISCGF